MRYRRSLFGAVGVVVALGCMFLSGCGASQFKVAPAAGKVTLDGKPVADLIVTFQPMRMSESQDVGPQSAGTTNDQGVFELALADGSGKKGAVVGKHAVRFVRVSPRSPEGESIDPPADPALDAAIAKTQTSKVEAEVPPSGSKDLSFELKK